MKEKLQAIIKEQLTDVDVNPQDITIEVPKETKFGDYSSNIAMVLCKQLHKSPIQIAEEIQSGITEEFIERIEVVKPGFLNFYVKKDYLLENIFTVIEQGENYGRNDLGKNTKINIEYVSANPTGILHLGHARGACFGDSLSRIMDFCGYDVTREYYINDAGNQMNNLGISIKERYKEALGLESSLPEDGYHGKEIIEIAENLKETYGKTLLEKDINYFREYGLQFLMDKIKEHLKQFHIEFDVWTSEQSLYENGKVDKALHKLKESGYTYEQDGALWLKTSAFGDEKDRVLVKKDGLYTYLTPDISYHYDKFQRGFDELIDVLGADHHGYINRLKASIQMLGNNPDKLDVEILQLVRLIQNGEEVKMSKRTGKAVTMNELMNEVGVDATRYFFIMRSLNSMMDFDMDLAVKKNNENPFYYVGYAHARICSILNSTKRVAKISKFDTINSAVAYNVLATVYEFEEVVKNCCKKRQPHLMTNYLYDLASKFHTYYSQEKIMTDDEQYSNERLLLIESVKIVLQNGLRLIGVIAPDKM